MRNYKFDTNIDMNKIIVLLFILLFIGCNEDEKEVCYTNDPLEEISWLSDIRDSFDKDMGLQRQRIIMYKYHGEYVFLIDDCYQCPDALAFVFDCEGKVICEFGGFTGINTCPDFGQNATDEKALYDG